MGKFSEYTNKEEADIELDWKPGQEVADKGAKGPEKLTLWRKLVLGLMFIKILFTTIALLWGFGSSVRYLLNLKNNYYPVVFYDSYNQSSNSSSNTLPYILVTNNVSNYTANASDSNNGTVSEVYYDNSTMENCRIYSTGQRAVFVTLQNNTFAAVEGSQFTNTPKQYSEIGFFEFEYTVDAILVIISLWLYVWTLSKDIIILIRQNKKYKGTGASARGDMYPDDTNSCSKRLGRIYTSIRDLLVLLIVDLGFVDIYNTDLNTCMTNVPPTKDIIARLVGQSDLVTSDTPNYNLVVGNVHIWMNTFSICVLLFLFLKLTQLICFLIAKCCCKEAGSGDRFRTVMRVIIEILVLTLISFLAVIMLVWRFYYLNWKQAGAAFSVSAKEIDSKQQSLPAMLPRAAIYSDRFIPQRPSISICEVLTKDRLILEDQNSSASRADDVADLDSSSNLYSSLLQMQILSDHNEEMDLTNSSVSTPTKKNSFNILKFKSPKRRKADFENQLNLHPFKEEKFLCPKVKSARKISRIPYKILDAPSLVDDYYLNLLDWSSTNLISVGLDNTVYIWSAVTNKASKIYEIASTEMICSVGWNDKASYLAVGESTGKLKLIDPETTKVVREMLGHTCRVSSIAWNGNALSTGSRDRTILTRDTRVPGDFVYKLDGHKQEICGLKWSFDENLLASGGNDNKIFIWNHKTQGEMTRFTEHVAAVKALAWSPHQHNILASGGGKSDRTIKVWNLFNFKRLESLDTGSQVCNMIFSVNNNELITTHGYSMNEICIWNYPSLQKMVTLTGHTSRVLYLSMSPNGENVVSGAGDETLRFWNVFPSKKNKNDDIFKRCTVQPSSIDLR